MILAKVPHLTHCCKQGHPHSVEFFRYSEADLRRTAAMRNVSYKIAWLLNATVQHKLLSDGVQLRSIGICIA